MTTPNLQNTEKIKNLSFEDIASIAKKYEYNHLGIIDEDKINSLEIYEKMEWVVKFGGKVPKYTYYEDKECTRLFQRGWDFDIYLAVLE